jgi:hypothetical protein|tara:strand:+ start:317 stop:517 length:201 start_codon:yes stop_codon:yes gene_type:complete
MMDIALEDGWRLRAEVDSENKVFNVSVSNEDGDIKSKEDYIVKSKPRFEFADSYSLNIDKEDELYR